MRWSDLEAIVETLTAPGGQYPIVSIPNGETTQRIYGGMPTTLRDLFERTTVHGDTDSLVYLGRRYSFRQVHILAASLSRRLLDDYGIQKGDRRRFG